MARFYANENFPRPVVQTLRELGHHVLTVEDLPTSERAAPDDDVLAFAVS
jgi:hypothetical protein